jgi:hypothetical protein
MMRKMYGKTGVPALGLALGLAILAACNNGLEAPRLKGEAGTGTVSISSEGVSTAARTLAPALTSFTRYVASFSGPAAQPDVVFTTNTKSVNLAPGSWSITVTAYTGAADSYTAVGRGSAAVTAVAGQAVEVATTITPITGEGGKGTLGYSVSFPAVDTASLKLTNLTANAQPVTFNLNTTATGDVANLDTGFYLLQISLVQGGKTAGKTDVVHIYKGLTTPAAYTFGGTDFGTAVTDISLDWTGDPPAVAVGGTVPLTAVIEPANATNKTVEWTTSDPDVATVDVDGTVTGVGPGTAVKWPKSPLRLLSR